MDASAWSSIDNQIASATGETFTSRSRSPISGGCINSAFLLESAKRRFFVKLNDASCRPMFDAEAVGLDEIAGTDTVRTPAVICVGTADSHAFLVLEHLNMIPATANSASDLGTRLAAMHSIRKGFFGWTRNNTIGATPQPNDTETSWPEFFLRHRLRHQLLLAKERHRDSPSLQSKGERLCSKLDQFFNGYAVYPSLLHGDLWGGNFSALQSGEAVIYDPAVYYGDRETDIAMTELFGGFHPNFYQAYSSVLPLDAGYSVRRELYKLYHVLNHLNLFGAGYAAQAEGLMDVLLAELG